MRWFLSTADAPLLTKIANRWPQLGPAVFMFVIMYGAVQLIRILVEWPLFHRRPYQTEFKSYLWGDRLGFWIFGAIAGRILYNYRPQNKWFDKRITRGGLLVFFSVAGVGNWLNAIRTGSMEPWRKFAPSEIYHSVMFGPVGVIIVHAVLSILFGTKARLRDKLIAVSPLSLWVVGLIEDIRSGR